MSTPNIEELAAQLSYYSGDGDQVDMARQAQRLAANALQSQAERIKELERESETYAKAYGLAIVERDNLRHELKVAQEGWRCECSTDDACRFARERDAKAEHIKELEADFSRLEATAQKFCVRNTFVEAENDTLRAQLDAIAATEPVLVVEKEPDYWSGGHFHEGSKPHVKPTKVWSLPIGTKLFTRPMPAQDVTELVDALERVLNCCDIAECGTVPNSPGALKNARTALSKYKGAK